MVGDRDRAEALFAGGREEHLDGRGAVARVVGVHVQVDVDQRPCRQAASQHLLALGGVPARPRARRRAARARAAARTRRRRTSTVLAREVPVPSASPVAGWLAVRASRRPKRFSTKRRPTSVESSALGGAVKEPRSASASGAARRSEVLGANGSWTWTKSSWTVAEQFLDRARHVDRQRRGRAAPGPPSTSSDLADGDDLRLPRRSPRAALAARRAARSARADSRTAPPNATVRAPARGARAERARPATAPT